MTAETMQFKTPEEVFEGRNPKLAEFQVISKLGEGTYGLVNKVKYKDSDFIYAMKKVKTEVANEEGIPATSMREIAILKRLKHENIVTLHCCIMEEDALMLMFEFIDMDLHKFQTVHGPLIDHPEMIRGITNGIARGVDFCLDNGILHRDLKPQNILVDTDNFLKTYDPKYIKVADYGLGREVGFNASAAITREVVTMWYRCPEILLGTETYRCGVDSWALGCIIAEMVLGQPLFRGDCDIDQLFKIFQVQGTPTPPWEDREEVLEIIELAPAAEAGLIHKEPMNTDWKDVHRLPAWTPFWPRWRKSPLSDLMPEVDPRIPDMLDELLTMDPVHRASPKRCLEHPFCTDTQPSDDEYCQEQESGL